MIHHHGLTRLQVCVCDTSHDVLAATFGTRYLPARLHLTHSGRLTHICKLIITGSDNGLSPERRQAIIWTFAGILLNGTLGTYFSQILSEIHAFSFKKMHLDMSSAKWRQFCLGLNVLISTHTRKVNHSKGLISCLYASIFLYERTKLLIYWIVWICMWKC